MEQQTQKKEWATPELIVLVRSKPEEAVLAACKQICNSDASILLGPFCATKHSHKMAGFS